MRKPLDFDRLVLPDDNISTAEYVEWISAERNKCPHPVITHKVTRLVGDGYQMTYNNYRCARCLKKIDRMKVIGNIYDKGNR